MQYINNLINSYLLPNQLIKSFKKIFILFALLFSVSLFAFEKDKPKFSDRFSAVGTGPYFGLGTTFKGESLVILQPNIHKDLALLKENQKMRINTGIVEGPPHPYVQLSGLGEVQAIFETQAKNSVNLTATLLDVDAWINKWMTVFSQFGIDLDEISNNNFRMIQGFITIGNLDYFPVYLTVGQIFVPFGSFSTGTSDVGSLPRAVGRLYQRALSIGFYPGNGLHVTGAIYNGKTKNSANNNLDQFAGTVSYSGDLNLLGIPSSVKTGVSYTNNIADAAATRNIFNSGAILSHYVSGFDAFASASVGPLVFRAEYVTALENFSGNDLLQAGKKVKPSSYLLEAEYDLSVFGKPSWVTLHYSELEQAAVSSRIQHQNAVNLGSYIMKNTILSIEYSHRKSYSSSNMLSNYAINDGSGLYNTIDPTALTTINNQTNGRTRNVLIGTLDVFF